MLTSHSATARAAHCHSPDRRCRLPPQRCPPGLDRAGCRLRADGGRIDLAESCLNLRRLSLVVFVDNAFALEMYRRLGFVVEGTMTGYGFKRGRYVDAHVMARLRDDTRARDAGGRTSVAPRPFVA